MSTLALPDVDVYHEWTPMGQKRKDVFESMFEGCGALETWTAPATWPLERSSVPAPTAKNGMWWSTRGRTWMTVDAIISRSPVADTYVATGSLPSYLVMTGPHSYALRGGHEPGARIPYALGMFSEFETAESIDLTGLDTSHVTDLSGMFLECRGLASIDLSGLDTSCVTSMEGMFAGCTSLRKITLSGLDTSQVASMANMFNGCTSLVEVALTGIDTSRVQSFSNMFRDCKKLATLDLTGLDFSHATDVSEMFKNISYLDTSSLEELGSCFRGCTSLESVDISFPLPSLGPYGWRSNPVESVFLGCDSIRRFKVSKWWPVSYGGALPKATNEHGVWWSCRDGVWMSNNEIVSRGKVADTYTSDGPNAGDESAASGT